MTNRGKHRTPTARADSAVAPVVAVAAATSASPAPRPATLWMPRLSANWIISLLLIASVFLVFGQTVRHKFINFDDDQYVTENREVRAGLTLHGLRYAFLRPVDVNWHPLTTLSHMLDCQLYGLAWPGGHHLTNVALHAATAIGLYLVLRQMTGRTACSAFAAFLFALHPLRVESVAWVAERKDVLSGLFFMLTLAAYVGYVRKEKGDSPHLCEAPSGPFRRAPSAAWSGTVPFFRYLLLPLVFALGLMCKPMLVTLPFVLLLLDYWPLGRFGGWTSESVSSPRSSSFLPLLLEKLPLFILSASSCAITLILQASAMPPLERITLAQRLGNCLLAYVGYLKMFFWPFGLAAYYPYSEGSPNPWAVAAAGVLLLAITIATWWWRQKHPYLLVGWLWYLGLLVPVIGLIQVGNQAMADRYTYLPLIGPTVALVWLVADLAGPSVNRRFAFSVAGSLILLFLAACTAWQTAYWRDDLTLWIRTIECTTDNYVARLHLGLTLSDRGLHKQAAVQYQEAIRIFPAFPEAHNNLAYALSVLGRIDAAIGQYECAVSLRPSYAKAHNNLGMLLLDRGDVAAAAEQFKLALAAEPGHAMAENNLGITLMAIGQDAAAAEHYRQAIALDSDFAQPHANLGRALGRLGQSAPAVVELRTFLRLLPDNPTALGWLAWILATARDGSVRNGPEAVALAAKAAALARESDPRILDALAAAYAETGQFAAATKTASAAYERAQAVGDNNLATKIQQRIELYRRSQPFRE